jgi:hypothetical protein
MRAVWAIAALLLAAAIAAAFLPRGTADTAPFQAQSQADPAPAPVPSVCPMPPEAAVPAVPASKALDELLGGSLLAGTAGPATAAPAVTVGAPAAIERIDERTVRVDGRYVIRGAGTESDPFAITWELLGSAAQTVDAASARFELPGRLADLRGAWVRISGYWAPPLMVFEAREAMVMLNKWDGCCVGLPPTPFDSIEATFVAPIKVQGRHLFRFGTVRGRLVVEPFVAGTFLLGLYRLEDAVLETSS